MGNDTNKQPEEKDTVSGIKSCREERQEVKITIDEISAGKNAGKGEVSEEEVKVEVEKINPDEASMNSRG